MWSRQWPPWTAFIGDLTTPTRLSLALVIFLPFLPSPITHFQLWMTLLYTFGMFEDLMCPMRVSRITLMVLLVGRFSFFFFQFPKSERIKLWWKAFEKIETIQSKTLIHLLILQTFGGATSTQPASSLLAKTAASFCTGSQRHSGRSISPATCLTIRLLMGLLLLLVSFFSFRFFLQVWNDNLLLHIWQKLSYEIW